MTSTETEVEPIGVRRRRLERQLADLRRSRGRAVADGRPFNSQRIAEVEDALAALEDADIELERREESDRVKARKQAHADGLVALDKATRVRVDAAKALDDAALTLGDMVRAFLNANAAELAICHTLGRDHAPNDLTPQNAQTRAMAYLRPKLRIAVGASTFADLDVGPRPGDPTQPPAAHEARTAIVRDFYARKAPK